jgi:hypothetical protein
MKFVLVNGRRADGKCTWCCEPIGDSYLREVATRNAYCNYECYLTHYKSVVASAQEREKAS